MKPKQLITDVLKSVAEEESEGMGHKQEHHNLLFELSLIFFGMFIIKVMPEASTVTIGFMSAVCFILGKYGKYFSTPIEV